MTEHTPVKRGTLFLIVGPSGAGKDTLIAAARKELSRTHVFPRRTITRPSVKDAEDHVSKTVPEFDRLVSERQFALTWKAHNLQYGIPASIEDELKGGRHVVINVSRAVVDSARSQYRPSRTILVTASPAALRTRLVARGREVPSDLESRLAREQRDVRPDVTVENEASLETAIAAFVKALHC
ncbi:MAG: phosphonate metabolism protein/1,5-bisphosphokinase (PRPP-forming) PhnN [Micropepsaceae bacterium]